MTVLATGPPSPIISRGALSDITRRKLAEIEVRRARDQAEEALEQQTAMSEILRVMSRSPTDAQPVFELLAQRAGKLCNAEVAVVSRFDGRQIERAAIDGITPEAVSIVRNLYPMQVGAETVTARVIRGSAVVHIADVLADPRYAVKDFAVAAHFRAGLGVPIVRDGQVLGSIFVGRGTPGLFADSRIDLLKAFADQAAIAIENVRLFTELEARTAQLTRSVGELKALGEVGQAVSSTLDLETVLATIVSRATQLAGMDGGSIWEYDEAREEFYLHATDRLPDELVDTLRATPIRKGEGALGRLAMTGEPVEIRDIADERAYQSRVREILMRSGYRAVLAVPLLREDRLLGALAVNRTRAGAFAPEVIELLKTFATQSALAIQNARLFREIEIKSRELEATDFDLPAAIENALKFTPDGGTIDVLADVNGGEVAIAVRDTGVGISPEDQEAVFEEFRQVGRASKKVEGTGLGLAISRKFIELHGGRIRVESRIGTGSTFTFTLPLH